MKRLLVAQLALGLSLAACARSTDVVSPISGMVALTTSTQAAPESVSPNFNLEVILRPSDGADGFGHVTFRQANDPETRIDLGVWVRDLAPNTHYRLQRAVDLVVDDHCTSNSWLTLGEGTVARDIITDDRGTAKQDLFRVVANPIGTAFDIHFRVVTTAGVPVLTSDCYQYYVR